MNNYLICFSYLFQIHFNFLLWAYALSSIYLLISVVSILSNLPTIIVNSSWLFGFKYTNIFNSSFGVI